MEDFNLKEFIRLRKDFEGRASEYHDLSLTFLYVTKGKLSEQRDLHEKNHVINLWQYLGQATLDALPTAVQNIQITPHGLVNNETTAFALIEGEECDVFVRMAKRAGSLLPDSLRREMMIEVMDRVTDQSLPGKPIFAQNSNSLAVWLSFVITSLKTIQSNRVKTFSLDVDVFTASLSTLDYIISKMDNSKTNPAQNTVMKTEQKRFKVALSFPGEQREYVSLVAQGLKNALGNEKIFYDRDYQSELARPNLDVYLQQIYLEQTELVVIFLCAKYSEKEWCGLEWRAIREKIKVRQDESIMFCRFDDTEVAGVFSIDGFLDLRYCLPDDAVREILKRVV